jgi:hypothetical protein
LVERWKRSPCTGLVARREWGSDDKNKKVPGGEPPLVFSHARKSGLGFPWHLNDIELKPLRDPNMFRFEQVEEPRRVLGAGTIVKRHGQIGALDPRVSINPVGRACNVGSRWGRFALVLSLGAVVRAKERDAKK